MNPKLYIIGTPIGNIKDITIRALETLNKVDIIACEDTRHTLKLLNSYEIKKPLISYYKHKEIAGAEQIIELIRNGKTVALVSDAGMPCISDPGSILVNKLMENEIEYTVIPGANAALSAIALSGTDGVFTFLGFLPDKKKDFLKFMEKYKHIESNLIIYSAPHDLNKNLENLYECLGERNVFLVKEITKIYETVTKGKLSSIRIDEPKGEYVVILELKKQAIIEVSDDEITKLLISKISQGKEKKTAVNEICADFDINKNRVYKLSIKI